MESHISLKLDKAFHQKARLGIVSILMVKKEAEFNYLKARLKMTDGNLSSHLSQLEKMKYVRIKKKFEKKRPKTLCVLTDKGRLAFKSYLNQLEEIILSIPGEQRRKK
jgi:DNA-binding MarR family transcriptional regulator